MKFDFLLNDDLKETHTIFLQRYKNQVHILHSVQDKKSLKVCLYVCVYICMCVWVCLFVCVCVCERGREESDFYHQYPHLRKREIQLWVMQSGCWREVPISTHTVYQLSLKFSVWNHIWQKNLNFQFSFSSHRFPLVPTQHTNFHWNFQFGIISGRKI